jgi:hypothetical protein
MRPDSRTSLERASWVTSVRTRREDRSLHRRLILSQTSAGKGRRYEFWDWNTRITRTLKVMPCISFRKHMDAYHSRIATEDQTKISPIRKRFTMLLMGILGIGGLSPIEPIVKELLRERCIGGGKAGGQEGGRGLKRGMRSLQD